MTSSSELASGYLITHPVRRPLLHKNRAAIASPLFEKIQDRVLNNDSERNAENKLVQHYPCVLSDRFLAFNLSQ